MQLTASDFYTYYRPSKCGLRLYLTQQGETGAPQSLYEQLLIQQSQAHRQRHLASLGQAEDLGLAPLFDRVRRTAELVRQKTPVIFQGALKGTLELEGEPCEIYAEPDFLIYQDGGYLIRNARLARNMKEHPELRRQLQVCAVLFEQNFGQLPKGIEVLGGNDDLHMIAFREDLVLRHLTEIRNFKKAEQEPESLISWSKCSSCSYQRRCWDAASQRRDISLIPGLEQRWTMALYQQGIRTVEQLLASFNEAELARVGLAGDGPSHRIGSREARRILASARAISTNQAVWMARPELPRHSHYVMFDLEGVPCHLSDPHQVFIWGLQVCGDPSPFEPVVIDFRHNGSGDRICWEQFLARAQAIFNRYQDIPFVHWGNYEPNRLRDYIQRFGDPDGTGGRVLRNLLDMLPVLQQSLVLPLPGYSLKIIEKHVGFQRRQSEYGGDWAIVKYIEALEAHNEQARQSCLDQILVYNQDDLGAMWAVLDWMLAQW